MNNPISNNQFSMNNSIEVFELDLDIYSNIFNNSPRLKENAKEFKNIITTFDKLSEDIYLSLFKKSPVVKITEDMSLEYQLNNILIKKLFEIDEFDSLRYACSLKHFDSILVADLIGQEIMKHFEALCETDKSFNNELQEHNKMCKEYIKTLFLKGEDSKVLEEKLNNNIINIEKMISNDNLIFKSVSNASKEFFAVSNTIKSWGLNDGILTPTSYEEKIEVSAKLRKLKKVKEISEMAGRFKASASQLQKRKTKEEGQEICGVQLGNEIHKILPSEKLLLIRKSTKRNFYKKYTQKELLSYKYRNNKAKSKGPIICCLDTSASMEGELEIWSKSVAIALLDMAIKQNRDFVAILFSNKVYRVIEFNKCKIEPNKLYQLATFFYGSGTNFVEPLEKSLQLISGARYKYSDIIFITDGEADIEEEFVEEFNIIKEKKQFRMISVNVSDKIEKDLDKINDIQILLKDLTDEEIEGVNDTLFSI